MGRRILAIIAAAVIALVGAILVLLYARGADQRAIEDASPTTVFVTTAQVSAGTSLKEALRLEQLNETQVAASAVPEGALTVVDDTNSALVALTDIAPGEYVLSAAFGEEALGEKALQVGAGKLAVSVQLSDPARVGTFVTPGSDLTVFMTYKIKRLGTSEEDQAFNDLDVKGTSVLLDTVKVIAMGEASLNPTPAQQQNEDTAAGRDRAEFLGHSRGHARAGDSTGARHQQLHLVCGPARFRGHSGSEAPHGRHDDREWCSPVNILWDADPTAVERYRFAVGSDTQALETAATVARALHDNLGIQQVVIGPEVSLSQACELAEAARLDRPELGVILLRHRVDVTALQQALRSGVREVVPAEDQTALVEALRRSRELTAKLLGSTSSGGPGADGKVITVFSAKGGVGKTTLSTNIAAHLADTGHRTVLIDLDLAFGDVAISLQLVPEKSIYDAVAMAGNLDGDALDSLVTTHVPSGLDVVVRTEQPWRRGPHPGQRRLGAHQGGPAALRLCHRRHAALLHRARPGCMRRLRRVGAHRDTRHPCGEEPPRRHRHVGHARQPQGLPHHRAEPRRCKGWSEVRRRRRGHQGAHRGQHPQLRHGPLVGQSRGCRGARRATRSGEHRHT